MINIATVLLEDIEKNFREVLPKNCVRLLMMMAEQNLQLEKALNDQNRLLKKVAAVVVHMKTAENLLGEINEAEERLARQSAISTESIRKGDIEQ